MPLWLKLAWTLLTVATFAAYAGYYSFAHSFLWFSSLALLLTCLALWLEHPLLAGMQAVGVLVLETLYTIDFFVRLTAGVFLTGLSMYFFRSEDSPIWVRAFSLFHISLPFMLVWLVWRLGYDRRAWAAQTAVAWVLLPVCYFFTDPADNVNWVFGPRGPGWEWMPRWGWLVLLMLGLPTAVYAPTHWVLKRVFPAPANARPTAQSAAGAA